MKCPNSSLIIDLLKDKKEAVEKIETIGDDAIVTTRVNVYEIFFGAFIKKGIDHQKFSEKVSTFMGKIKILELDELGAIRAAEIKSSLVLSGKEIEYTDCLIAGIMLANGCKRIITKNKDHFERIKEIGVEGY